MAGPQLEKWAMDSARDRAVRELDVIQSEWPAHTSSWVTSGYTTPNSGSASLLLSVPSSKWFKPRMIWADNENTQLAHLMFYAGGSAGVATATLGGLHVAAQTTTVIAFDCVTTGRDIWVDATVASCHVRIGGILLASAPEYGQE